MNKIKFVGLLCAFFLFPACAETTSRSEYCAMRIEALGNPAENARSMMVILIGDGTLGINDNQRMKEFAIFAKILLAENGVSEKDLITFGLGILEYGMPRVFPRDDKAQACVDRAESIAEINLCLEHIPSWKNADANKPGVCPDFKRWF